MTSQTLVGKQSKEAVIADYLPLVHRIAQRYVHSAVQNHYEDLVQVGSIGLIRAIERFDSSRSASFKTYASHVITSEIRHYLRDQVATVRLPRDLQELLPRVHQAEQELSQRLDRSPESDELAAHLQITVDKLEEVYQMATNYAPISLNQKAHQHTDNDITLIENIEDDSVQSFQLAHEDRLLLQGALSNIKAQSRQLIEFAFYEDLTQTEIAKHLGISQMQVSRRLKKAMGELWDTLNTRVTPW